MPAPKTPPLGLHLAATAKSVRRAFDDALAGAGGSLPVWLILISIKRGDPGNQRDLAAAVGITGATLTHHLNAMEADGLLVRRRDPSNRRIQRVELTEAGENTFHRLRGTATAFDKRLRAGLTAQELDVLADLLKRLQANV
ncbi:MarR family winged helix-turn-helix transcriptional regulator [Leekyejoonella antrihumi]|uniref:Winged helix-turn-helix transcriptional regulator n=1 Tax=Leekyejoonella antrihumi TaxID=1660198 RepID=A0A563E7Z3_9MICO|nr:MarR family winged helix-turn-helix transcriptional regulator [Leekyejoonella antrihumi]TWP38322.1 winged helix-turn-helix transcriptional regulator [Leekyejoonella antrihumi]